jgi:hypothetical protein
VQGGPARQSPAEAAMSDGMIQEAVQKFDGTIMA